MDFHVLFVAFCLVGMIWALVRDQMRPGMILFSVVVLFLCAGILTPKEAIEGFSNKGMITVALLFLVSEGVRNSGVLEKLISKMLPPKKGVAVPVAQARMLPIVAAISAFLNNTPVVVIFAPMIRNWARRMKLPPSKFLIPLSYATILGGMCTLIGTSTNLVVDGMMLEAGYPGFTIFELGKVGIFIAIVGLLYLIFASAKLLPNHRSDTDEDESETASQRYCIEAVLGSRFPGNGKTLVRFDFYRHYGATVKSLHRNGERITENWQNVRLRENDMLVLEADES